MSTAEELVQSEHDAVMARSCTAKVRYGAKTARKVAQEMRADGHGVSPYRCPFAEPGDSHWHVGHSLSLAGMETMARVIRGLPPQPKEAGQA